MFKASLLRAAALSLAVMAVPGGAWAAHSGYPTTNLNLRAGPSTRYPTVDTIPAGASVTIHGCISRYRWCDVSFDGIRGWASGGYLQFDYEGRRVYVPQYARQVNYFPVVNFNITNYWEEYYHDRDFYSRIHDWDDIDWDHEAPEYWLDEWD